MGVAGDAVALVGGWGQSFGKQETRPETCPSASRSLSLHSPPREKGRRAKTGSRETREPMVRPKGVVVSALSIKKM